MEYDILACPYCKRKVNYVKGFLVCKCGKRFPVRGNIPVFSETANKAEFYQTRYGVRYEDKLDKVERLRLEKILNRLERTNLRTSLDIGCNPAMTKIIARNTGSRTVGLNIIPSGMYAEGEWALCDMEIGLPFVKEAFDLVFCGELIEHVLDTDHFISEARRVLKKGGYLVLTTPNMASFWNRIFLLLGLQPDNLGVSLKKSYGNPVLKWDRSWCHAHVFTHRALKEFLSDNGFRVLKTYGQPMHNAYEGSARRFLRRIVSEFPSIAEDMVFICRKR